MGTGSNALGFYSRQPDWSEDVTYLDDVSDLPPITSLTPHRIVSMQSATNHHVEGEVGLTRSRMYGSDPHLDLPLGYYDAMEGINEMRKRTGKWREEEG